MVGLEVKPVTDKSSMYLFSVPLVSRSRVMLSSQRLWPRSCSALVAFMVSSPFQGHECRQSEIIQIADLIQLNVRRLVAGKTSSILRVMALHREHGGYALAPDLFDRIEDTPLIVDHDIALCRINALHFGKFKLLVDINEHAAVKGGP